MLIKVGKELVADVSETSSSNMDYDGKPLSIFYMTAICEDYMQLENVYLDWIKQQRLTVYGLISWAMANLGYNKNKIFSLIKTMSTTWWL